MGVERAVTLWYLHHQQILDEIAALEAQLAQPSAGGQPSREETPLAPSPSVADLPEQLAQAQAKLRALGPCPKPMMG